MLKRKVWWRFLFGLALGAAAPAVQPAAAGPGPEAQAPGPFDLTLFHTNDGHGHFLPRPASWRDDGKMVGGTIPLAWHLADQRRTAPADLLVDAGDFMTGNPVCNLERDGIPGFAVAEMMNALGYDAGVVGNHEFDIGREDLGRLLGLFGFPVLGIDLSDERGRPFADPGPVILERGGLRVGIVGISNNKLDELVIPARLGGLKMGDQAALVRERAAQLDPATDLIVVLSHDGVDQDRLLAEALAGSGVDVIVGGHSHTRLKEPEVHGGIIIVQAGSKLTDLGRLDLQVRDDRVTAYHGSLITLWSDGTHAEPGLTDLVRGFENEVHERFGRVIGTLAVDLRKGGGETLLGNWLADVLRDRAGADVALMNSGGIRKELLAGPLTALDIHEILPFANSLITMDLSGEQLLAVVQRNADAAVKRDHGILQVSGLSYAYRADPQTGSAVLTEVLVGGRPLDPAATYTVALPDYVVTMAHVYLDIEVPAITDLGVTLTQAVIESVETAGAVTPRIEGRIRELD